MIRLRPHHLLCTQSYAGRGYDDAFTANMDRIVTRLREERGLIIDLVFSTDDICTVCPRMLGEDHCVSNKKVKHIDERMIHHFGLLEKPYVYDVLTSHIRALLTAEMFEDICSSCNWYSMDLCRSPLLGR